jgi:glutamate formiminotransferase
MKIIECVPNVSEGRDRGKIDAIAEEISRTPGVKLLDVCVDRDHHRSVFSFIGSPDDVVRAALTALACALDRIDMREHRGVHPRIGAVDVVPFVPLKGAAMKDAVEAAHRFGYAFGERNGVPVYFYGEAALSPQRRELPDIRRGGYEGLTGRMEDPQWTPDAGPAAFHPKSGATAVGARQPLIAFNVNLRTDDLSTAREIARNVRFSSGGLRHVKAIGVPLNSRNIVQVSMNLTNFRETSVSAAFYAVKEEASKRGVAILESELVGLIPKAALEGISADDLRLSGFREECIIETHLP